MSFLNASEDVSIMGPNGIESKELEAYWNYNAHAMVK